MLAAAQATTPCSKTGPLIVEAELNDSPTAQAIVAGLPIKGNANCWGDEIYFRIPVSEQAMSDAPAKTATSVPRRSQRCRNDIGEA